MIEITNENEDMKLEITINDTTYSYSIYEEVWNHINFDEKETILGYGEIYVHVYFNDVYLGYRLDEQDIYDELTKFEESELIKQLNIEKDVEE